MNTAPSSFFIYISCELVMHQVMLRSRYTMWQPAVFVFMGAVVAASARKEVLALAAGPVFCSADLTTDATPLPTR
jgi:hypothetical protein